MERFQVELTTDISGGFGNHAKGTTLRNLTERDADMLVESGQAKGKRAMAEADAAAAPEAGPTKGKPAK